MSDLYLCVHTHTQHTDWISGETAGWWIHLYVVKQATFCYAMILTNRKKRQWLLIHPILFGPWVVHSGLVQFPHRKTCWDNWGTNTVEKSSAYWMSWQGVFGLPKKLQKQNKKKKKKLGWCQFETGAYRLVYSECDTNKNSVGLPPLFCDFRQSVTALSM